MFIYVYNNIYIYGGSICVYVMKYAYQGFTGDAWATKKKRRKVWRNYYVLNAFTFIYIYNDNNKVIDFRRAKFVIVMPVTIDAVIPCSVIAFTRPRVGRFRQIFHSSRSHVRQLLFVMRKNKNQRRERTTVIQYNNIIYIIIYRNQFLTKACK